jgi:RNA polymerase sigma-B factor
MRTDAQHATDAPRQQRAEEAALFERYTRTHSPVARDANVARFLPLARQLARRYSRGDELEDLEQVAALGLIKAIERFDPKRGLAFSSFAFPTIAGEIKRYLRDHGWSVRVPRDLQETSLRIDRATADLTSELGRAPTASELANRITSTVETVLEARQTVTARRAVSLDQPTQHGGEETSDTLGTTVGVEEPGFGDAENAAALDTLFRGLSDREQLLLRLRFHEDLTQTEIGDRVGLSQMQVSRLLRTAIHRLQLTAGTPPSPQW